MPLNAATAAARLSVAPMMDWTTRDYRAFARTLTRRTLLYTEMVTTQALIRGDAQRHLAYSPEEHPLALQLGGSGSKYDDFTWQSPAWPRSCSPASTT